VGKLASAVSAPF